MLLFIALEFRNKYSEIMFTIEKALSKSGAILLGFLEANEVWRCVELMGTVILYR